MTELPVLSSKLGNSGGFCVIRCSAKSNEKGKARMEPYGWAPLHTSTALVVCTLPQSLWASDCFSLLSVTLCDLVKSTQILNSYLSATAAAFSFIMLPHMERQDGESDAGSFD